MTEIDDTNAAIERLTVEKSYCRRQAETMRSIVNKQRGAISECQLQLDAAEGRFDAISEELKQWQERRTKQCKNLGRRCHSQNGEKP